MAEVRMDRQREIAEAPVVVSGNGVEMPVASAEVREVPTETRQSAPPLDALEGRIRETARGCIAAYRTWRQSTTDLTDQGLRDAVHELRKALARLEIEMSAGRREERAPKPIPIPAHRAARRTR